ncbi:hypothetical protein F25303_4295 [Fusarium sp. NRRL 25303]|nr:hypothetical protein F25303_4295 [Fusarium sp. NRRL 25303]
MVRKHTITHGPAVSHEVDDLEDEPVEADERAPFVSMLNKAENGAWWSSFRHKVQVVCQGSYEDVAAFAARAYASSDPAELGMLVVAYARSTGYCHDLYGVVDRLAIPDYQHSYSAEAMELLLLLAKAYSDIGQPRQSWMMYRKGLAISEVMGLYRREIVSPRLKSIWWAFYHGDRFSSLLLGLPYGFNDAHLGPTVEPYTMPVYPEQRFVLRCASIAGKIIDRNMMPGKPSSASSMLLDEQMDTIASSMPLSWWDLPESLPNCHAETDELRNVLLLHFYFFHVRINLHLPFIVGTEMTSARSSHRLACSEASRHLLRRFTLLRTEIQGFSIFDCKTSDFVGFMACVSLILCLSQPKPDEVMVPVADEDQNLIAQVKGIFERQEGAGCKVACQCRRMLDILSGITLDSDDSPSSKLPSRIAIPHFGYIRRDIVQQAGFQVKGGVSVARSNEQIVIAAPAVSSDGLAGLGTRSNWPETLDTGMCWEFSGLDHFQIDDDLSSWLDTAMLDWLHKVNILGRPDQGASQSRPVTFTGTATYSHYNWYALRSRNNPLVNEYNEGKVRVYDWSEDHDVLIPFHFDCYELLKKIAGPAEIDAQVIYEIFRSHCDDLICEALIFGTTEDDLSKVTAIGVDALLRGLEVCFSNGESRTIGHTNAMQYVSIGGPGGERILYFTSKMSYYPSSFQFVTNKGRTFVAAEPSAESHVMFPKQGTAVRREALMGIYCHWANRHTPGTDLNMVGAFTRKSNRVPLRRPRLKVDDLEHFWTPELPPRGIMEVGKVYDQREYIKPPSQFVHYLPTENTLVSWFDFSRPVASIKVGLCHGSLSSQIPLVAMTFKYADDQTTTSIGPTRFSPPKDKRGTGGNYWCWCAEGDCPEEELAEKPHYTEDEWNAKGADVKFVRLWVDDEGILTGLHFIARYGVESPAWGYCEGERPVRLPLQAQKKNRAAGLKVYVDTIDRDVTREDFVVDLATETKDQSLNDVLY